MAEKIKHPKTKVRFTRGKSLPNKGNQTKKSYDLLLLPL